MLKWDAIWESVSRTAWPRRSTMRPQSASSVFKTLFSSYGEIIPLYHFPYDYAHDVTANLTHVRSNEDDARPYRISISTISSCTHLKVCEL